MNVATIRTFVGPDRIRAAGGTFYGLAVVLLVIFAKLFYGEHKLMLARRIVAQIKQPIREIVIVRRTPEPRPGRSHDQQRDRPHRDDFLVIFAHGLLSLFQSRAIACPWEVAVLTVVKSFCRNHCTW